MMTDSKPRVRFAPSPTGFLHIGGARTALFNWLFARNLGGTMLLRFEDTDRERSTQASVDQVLDALKWLGIEFDEGPFYQSQRDELYNAALEKFEASGALYRSYLTGDEIQERREAAEKSKQNFFFKRAIHDLTAEEADARAAAGAPYTLRFDVGTDGTVAWNDNIRGHVEIPREAMDDFIVARSDGSPMYNFVCAFDDVEMKISHVIRGEDHISNTAKQILIIEALGAPMPEYGHVSLILGPDKKRLSKRHGATSLQQYRNEGYLPEAIINFLALLGWSLDDQTEFFTREQLVEHFSLDRVNKSAAVFDQKKLTHLNGLHLRGMPLEHLAALAKEQLLEKGATSEDAIAEKGGDAWLASLVALAVDRSSLTIDLYDNLLYYFKAPKDYDTKGVKKFFMKVESLSVLRRVKKYLDENTEFMSEEFQEAINKIAADLNLNFGKVAQPVRLALTGKTAAPGVYDIIKAVGVAESAARLEAAVQWINRERDRQESESTIS
jgi:glutamyl-tRNA synthetase